MRTRPNRVIGGGACPGESTVGDGEVGDEVLRDRRHLAGDGLVVPVVAISRQSGRSRRRRRDHARVRPGRADRGAVEGIPSLLAATLEAASVEERTDPDSSRKDSRGPAAVLPQAVGPPAARVAGRDGDLTWPSAHLPACQRVCRRGAVRARLDLVHLACDLQRGGSRVVLQHRARHASRRISPAGSVRSSASCRTSCSAIPPI